MLVVSNLSKVTAAQLTLGVEMIRFLSWLVTRSPTILGASQWDFLLCSMLAWLEVRSCHTFDRCHRSPRNSSYSPLSRALSQMCNSLSSSLSPSIVSDRQ